VRFDSDLETARPASCNLAGFPARSTIPLKDLEPPAETRTRPQNLAPRAQRSTALAWQVGLCLHDRARRRRRTTRRHRSRHRPSVGSRRSIFPSSHQPFTRKERLYLHVGAAGYFPIAAMNAIWMKPAPMPMRSHARSRRTECQVRYPERSRRDKLGRRTCNRADHVPRVATWQRNFQVATGGSSSVRAAARPGRPAALGAGACPG
jgi:hypothetical protein